MARNAPKTPAPPDGLQESGRALWRAVLDDYELDTHELSMLTQAARLADLCDTLQATIDAEGIMATSSQGSRVHPAAVELRQTSIALARMLTALRIPQGEDDGRTQRRPGVRGVYGIAGAS